ncbi:THO complex subunit 4-like [Varroa jacobsoni]|uniref:RRM domain-containing protein n=1 Tax=Varroa destructor TaxID=109461 RepID=A0A7M7JEP0_VARDE|nr:THO complex subunit 4-like [Varroa destructor]XP_022709937.1 THO complex subunit 4-like [Varroa jacobsoni]
MAEKVDMSLDDIIKANRAAFRTGRGRGGFRGRGGRGAGRGGPRGSGGRPAPRKSGFSNSPRKPGFSGGAGRKFPRGPVGKGTSGDRWQHDKFQYRGAGANNNGVGGGPGARDQSSKLTISNLDYGVSDADIKELFTEFGPLKKAAVHYDRSGRSLGTADVIFERRSDALRAMKQYNDVPLDGRPMKIELVGDKPSAGGGAVGGGRVLAGRIGKKPRGGGSSFRGQGNEGANRRAGGGGKQQSGRGNTRGGRKVPAKTPTKEELDAELDAYVSKMDTA